MGKLMRALLIFLGGVIAIWCLSFGLFVIDAVSFKEIAQEQCDNVVVLTGGKNRIRHALQSIKSAEKYIYFRSICENHLKRYFRGG